MEVREANANLPKQASNMGPTKQTVDPLAEKLQLLAAAIEKLGSARDANADEKKYYIKKEWLESSNQTTQVL